MAASDFKRGVNSIKTDHNCAGTTVVENVVMTNSGSRSCFVMTCNGFIALSKPNSISTHNQLAELDILLHPRPSLQFHDLLTKVLTKSRSMQYVVDRDCKATSVQCMVFDYENHIAALKTILILVETI